MVQIEISEKDKGWWNENDDYVRQEGVFNAALGSELQSN